MILVTGAAGFIGYHTCQALLAANHRVIGVDNLNDYYDVSLKTARLKQLQPHANFQFVKLDLTDAVAVKKLFQDHHPTHVIHLAAQPGVRYSLTCPEVYINANINAFMSLLEACRHYPVQHLVFASTSSVYGANAKQPYSEHHGTDHPVSLYAASKKANELMAHSYADLFQLPVTGLRFFTVYGPWGRPDMSPFKFTKAIIEGTPIEIYNHGDMQRDFTYIDDIVTGVLTVMQSAPSADPNWDKQLADPATSYAPYRIYNIGHGQPIKLLDYIEAIEHAVGKTALKKFLPLQPGDMLSTYADTSELERAFGYKPTTSLQDGVNQFVQWYRSYYT